MGNVTTRPTYVVNDLFTWIKGNHTIKAGFEYRNIGGNIHANGNEAGTFGFGRGATGLLGINSGSPIASFLLGAVDNASVDLPVGEHRLSAAGCLHPPRWATPGRSTAS